MPFSFDIAALLRAPGRLRAAFALALAGLAAWTVVLLLPALSLAAAAKGEDTPLSLGGDGGGGHTGSGSGGIARVIGGLFIVIAVIYGVTWILRQTRKSRQQTVGVGIESVSTMPLAGGGALQLVRVGDELLLLAGGANGANVVRRYDEDEARALELWPDPEAIDPASRPAAVVSPLARAYERVLERLRDWTVRR